MRKVIVSTYMTTDGRVDDVQDWVVPYNADEAASYHTDLLAGSDALLLGRRTYELFAAMWPPRAGELPYIDKLNRMTKYVASTTLAELGWENSHLLEGDAAEAVAALKREPGQDLVMYGSNALMHRLLGNDLIDEYRLLVHPVLYGKGRRFFDDGAGRVNLELVDTAVKASGVVVLTYRTCAPSSRSESSHRRSALSASSA
jgi:dihydrofolate reductase